MFIDFFVQYWGVLFQGFLYTLFICATGITLGLLVGVLACAGKLSRFSVIRWGTDAYIEFFRGTPYLIQVFILYYVAPVFGLDLSTITVGIVSLALYGGAYFAEVYRSGIQSIPKGQIEASRALGIGEFAILFRVVIPQMMGLILAPLTNQAITLIKDSAILSVITLEELTFAGQRVIGETFRYVEVYMIVAVLYWAFNTALSVVSARLEWNVTHYLRVNGKRKQSKIAQSEVPEEVRV